MPSCEETIQECRIFSLQRIGALSIYPNPWPSLLFPRAVPPIIFLIKEIEREMKFKAFLTDNGVNLLEKRFLPALDKMGRICHLILTHITV